MGGGLDGGRRGKAGARFPGSGLEPAAPNHLDRKGREMHCNGGSSEALKETKKVADSGPWAQAPNGTPPCRCWLLPEPHGRRQEGKGYSCCFAAPKDLTLT